MDFRRHFHPKSALEFSAQKVEISPKLTVLVPDSATIVVARSGIAILQLNLPLCNPIENQALAAGRIFREA
jgi:hypothetical protein